MDVTESTSHSEQSLQKDMCKWGFRDANQTQCDCGTPAQAMQHLLVCLYISKTTRKDLNAATDSVIKVKNILLKVNIVLN